MRRAKLYPVLVDRVLKFDSILDNVRPDQKPKIDFIRHMTRLQPDNGLTTAAEKVTVSRALVRLFELLQCLPFPLVIEEWTRKEWKPSTKSVQWKCPNRADKDAEIYWILSGLGGGNSVRQLGSDGDMPLQVGCHHS